MRSVSNYRSELNPSRPWTATAQTDELKDGKASLDVDHGVARQRPLAFPTTSDVLRCHGQASSQAMMTSVCLGHNVNTYLLRGSSKNDSANYIDDSARILASYVGRRDRLNMTPTASRPTPMLISKSAGGSGTA